MRTFLLLVLTGACCVAASSSATTSSGSGSVDGGNSTSAGGHHGSHVHASAQEIGFLTICIFLGIVSRKCIEPKICLRFVPYTVILLLAGAVIGWMSIYTQFDDSKGGYGEINRYCHMSPAELVAHDLDVHLGCSANLSLSGCACTDAWSTAKVNILHNLSPHVILFVFLPPLIFESAFFMDFHIFIRSMIGVSVFAWHELDPQGEGGGMSVWPPPPSPPHTHTQISRFPHSPPLFSPLFFFSFFSFTPIHSISHLPWADFVPCRPRRNDCYICHWRLLNDRGIRVPYERRLCPSG